MVVTFASIDSQNRNVFQAASVLVLHSVKGLPIMDSAAGKSLFTGCYNLLVLLFFWSYCSIFLQNCSPSNPYFFNVHVWYTSDDSLRDLISLLVRPPWYPQAFKQLNPYHFHVENFIVALMVLNCVSNGRVHWGLLFS